MNWIRGFLIGLQFFTAIPISKSFPIDQAHLKRTIQVFPLIGLFQGMIYSFLLYKLVEYTPFSHVASAFLLWLATILVTGGIHLDGWIDASDAYFSYRDREKRLEIMKDPRTGAFGVLSIIVLLSCRFLFIYEITTYTHLSSFLLIAVIPFFGKIIMGTVLLTVPSAKQEGLAYLFQQAGTKNSLWIYPLFIVAVLLLFPVTGWVFCAALCCYVFASWKVKSWFGGITGDILGATVEGTELILWLTVWLWHYFAMG
ncbi:adenosylcobinamide-GDP ribazoletransferase [Bacillus rubiinfantis]|uniref:adenosylcobinamide-GDP ribazoletransferase n=1 Tax=Bacillus rubiinfantis TaxID=1499680 RepID=UPI0005AB8F69|nr:adenosylcobinamide-GDP ribazoletransferase [Bacillus rubiinfantis]